MISIRALGVALGLALVFAGHGLFAQGAQIAFSGFHQDTSLPVEVTADQLKVNRADGTAVFTGNVVVGQGKMRLTASQVQVEYAKGGDTGGGRIARLNATGGVTLVTGPQEAAEGKQAVYTVDTGQVVMTGNVLLTQGQNALSGEKLVVDLKSGTGTMEGRVRTVLKPASDKAAPKAGAGTTGAGNTGAKP